ncbi:cilia- and flagella-associated protein 77 [Rhinophrynus dorsalis]
MENERFGVVRDSMKDNHLLQKAELGKVRRVCYPLPGSNFTYGVNEYIKDGGVSLALGQWKTIEAKAHQRKLERDFMALNRDAVKSGLVTAAEQRAYRNKHQIWRAINEGHIKLQSLNVPPDMTFGISTRPSTPINDLIENKYQREWSEQQRKAQEALLLKLKEQMKKGKSQDTRTTVLRRYQPPEDPAPLWHLPRFQKVGPHLDTFRTQKERQRAFSAHHSDAIARQGRLKQGIYNLS